MKRLLYIVLTAVAVTACAPANRDAARTDATSGGPAATATTATAPQSAAPAPAPAPQTPAEKPLSYYENKVAELHTSAGEIDIRFFPDVAPKHVRNFIDLAESGFYNGIKFHRVIPGFVIQAGDPNTISGEPATWGSGGSGKHVDLEPSTIHHARGIVSMARRGDDVNSASSQFFICVGDAASLDGGYSAFGQVTKGMDVVDKIVSADREMTMNRPLDPVKIESIRIRAANDAEKGPAPGQPLGR